jgi:hypothetical protein
VGDLALELAANQLEPPPPGGEESAMLLNRDHSDLLRLVEYAISRLRDEVNTLFNERQFNFPQGEGTLAPTAMGNIALSVGSYTRTRYHFNFEMFWPRLQKILQGEAFYALLQDAKTQLDFLVSAIWLAVLSVILWIPYLMLYGYSIKLYLFIAIGGPILIRGLYLLALQNYRAFTCLLRSAVDLYRISLVKALHIPPPSNSSQERQIWAVLNQQVAYGESLTTPYSQE